MAQDQEVEEAETLSPVYHSPTENIDSNGATVKNGGPDSANDTGGGGLKANITLFGGIMVIVGCIIGSGIFISPKGVHEQAGSVGLSLIIWVLAGVFSGIGAYCYAELGTFIQTSGGDYAYVKVAFGPFAAFLRMWIECIIVRPCTITAVAMTFAVYILRPFFPHCNPPANAPQLLAAGCIILLTIVNAISVRSVTMVQNVFTVAKLAALALIIITGLVLLCFGGEHVERFHSPFQGSMYSPGNIAMSFYFGLWAYNGWNYLNFVTEELENPRRNLPIAIAVSMILCIFVYTLTNVAFYAGVTNDELLESSAVAVTYANRYYGSMAWIMPVFVAFSCFGTVNGILLTSSRLFYVAGRENHMPQLLSMINFKLETPMPAVFITSFLSLVYLLLSNNIFTLISYVQIVNWLAIGVATAGLIYLRYTKPVSKFPRPLQVWLGYPIMFLIGCVFLVVFPLIREPVDTLIGLSIMLTGIPVYFVFVHWQSKPIWFTNAIASFTLSSQKLMLVVPEEKKSS